MQWNVDNAQFLLRALLFRAVTDLLHRPDEEPTVVTRPYRPALDLTLRLAKTGGQKARRTGHAAAHDGGD